MKYVATASLLPSIFYWIFLLNLPRPLELINIQLSMTQFTVHRRFKLLSGDGGRPLALGSEDTFPINGISVELIGGISRIRSSTKLYSSFAPQELSSLQPNRANDSWTSVREEIAHGGSESSDGECDDEYRDDDDDDLDCYRGLVLDLAYRPVNVVCWRRAICLEFMEKADVLEYYDQTVDSPSGSFNIPAVLRVPHFLQVVKRRRIKSNISRKNILYRDNYTCQYCSSRENLTIDHVLPVARGGEWTWENLVTACAKCNSKKGRKTLEEANMRLLQVPKAPKEYGILAIPLKLRKDIPNEWREYLG